MMSDSEEQLASVAASLEQLRTTRQAVAPSLPDLPSELIDILLEHLCASRSAAKRTVNQLHELCLVSRRWEDCFLPYLYEQVVLPALYGRSVFAFRPKNPYKLTGRLTKWGPTSSCSLFLRTLIECPSRATLVRHFSAHVPSPLVAREDNLSALPLVLSQFSNLTTLHLEDLRSPRDPALEAIPLGSFPVLKQCYLVGSHKLSRRDGSGGYVHPANTDCLFTGDVFPFWCAPRLCRMSLQYFALCWDGRKKPAAARMVAVERLDLIACIVNHHFTNDLFAIRTCSSFSLANARAIVDPLASPVLSLIPKCITELYLDVSMLEIPPEWDGSLRELTQLRTLTVDFQTIFGISGRVPHTDCTLKFPANMEQLNIIVATNDPKTSHFWLRMQRLISIHARLFPSLRNLHLRLVAVQQWTRSSPPRVHLSGWDHTVIESESQLDAAAAGAPGPRLLPTWPDPMDDEVPSDAESCYSAFGDQPSSDQTKSTSRGEPYSEGFLEMWRVCWAQGVCLEVSTKRYQQKAGGREFRRSGRCMRWRSTKEKVDLTFYRYSRYWLRQQGFTSHLSVCQ